VLPLLAPTLLVVPRTEPEAALPAVLPLLAPTLLVVPRTEPEAALPAVLPLLAPTLFVVPRTEPEAALPAVLPALVPVLSRASSWCFVRSSPFPLLPPATSPRESELPSPDSLCLPWALPEASPPAFALALSLACPL
jgi:hypothetical protein